MNGYGQCPRCGHSTVEHLKTHSHCWECGYFPESEIRLGVKKKLEAEAYAGRNFAANERAHWSELFDDDTKPAALSEDALDHYYTYESENGKDIS